MRDEIKVTISNSTFQALQIKIKIWKLKCLYKSNGDDGKKVK
jgi:hypothetical protein